MNRVLYVAGYGRSGSTVLERVLAANPSVIGIGEATNLERIGVFRDPDVPCACGAPVGRCPVWAPVRAAVASGSGGHDGVRAWFGGTTAARRVALRRLYDALFSVIPGPDRFVVDSSKTTRKSVGRAVALRAAGVDVRVIHLVRDPRAVVYSARRGDNVKLEAGVDPTIPFAVPRTAGAWTLANLAAGALGSPTLRVRYEDLVADPDATLRRIGAFSGLDVAPCLAALAAGDVPPTHQVSGNRNRKERTLVLRADRAWEGQLSPSDRALVACLTGGLARRYGYPVAGYGSGGT